MSNYKNLHNYINEDFIAPTVRLVVISKKEILLNKIVPKRSSLRDIFKNERLKEGKQYTLSGKPLNLDDKIIDIIPKNYNNLSNIELIIEEINLSIEDTRIYYEKLLKPYENPFRVLVFTPNEFDVSLKTYPKETIDLFQLNNYSDSASSFCNTPKDLYISGGKGIFSGNCNFWRINSIKTNIEKLKDLPIKKQNHSMIYIPKRYIYFIGGNNKNTFYYDELFDNFTSWAEMNKQVKSPSLVLVDNTYIYSFGEQNENAKNDFFERTNLKSSNPSWETIYLQRNQIFPIKDFGAAISDDNEIYFLGGRKERGEKIYKFNLLTKQIEKCKQENTTLKPVDKNFYPLNDYNSAMIPDTKIDENIQVVIFNKKRKKYRKVLYEKNLDEIVNNYNLSLDDSIVKENNQIKIVWKEFKNNYISIDDLPENMLYLPSIEDLKKGVDNNENELESREYTKEENKEFHMDNIYGLEEQNKLRKGGGKRQNNKNSPKLPTFSDPEGYNTIQDAKTGINPNQYEFRMKDNDNRLLNEKITSPEEADNNNYKELNDQELNNQNRKYKNPSITLKQLFGGNVDDKIHLKTKFIDYNQFNEEYIAGLINGQNPKSMIDPNKKIDQNVKGDIFDHNKSVNLQGIKIWNSNNYKPLTLKDISNKGIDEDIHLTKNNPKLIDLNENISGIIKGADIKDDQEFKPNMFRKKTVLRQDNNKEQSPMVEYGNTKGYKRPNIKKGKDFEHQPNFSILGLIEGKPGQNMAITLKELFGGDVNKNIDNINRINNKLIPDNNEENITGFKPGVLLSDIINSKPSYKNINKKKVIEENMPGIEGNVNINGQNLRGVKGKKYVGYTPGFDRNVNINGSKLDIKKPIVNDEYNPNTLKGLFNGDVNDRVHLTKSNIKLPQYKLEDISGYIQGTKTNQNIDIEMPNINIDGPQLRGKKGKVEGNIPGIGGRVNINGPEGETIEGNIPGIGKSININGPSIEVKKSMKDEDINPNTLKVIFAGDINDEIKLNKIDERLKLFQMKTISGNIKGIPSINYIIEYGSSKGFERPKIKKGKDFTHNPKISLEGTIKGTKYIPPTLQSLFEGDIDGNIHLNNNSIKMPKYKIRDDFSDYDNGKISSGNLDIHMPNVNINGPNLNLGNASGISGSVNNNMLNNNQIIEGNIQGIGGSVNINGPKLRNVKGTKKQIKGSLNIDEPLIDLNQKITYNKGYNNSITLKNIFNGDVNENINLNLRNNKLSLIEYDNYYGIIKGQKNDTNQNISSEANRNNNKMKNSQLKRSERLNFIEYGATIGYVRPIIKKGIDYEHKPRVKFEKYDSNSDLNIFSKPYIVDERKRGYKK